MKVPFIKPTRKKRRDLIVRAPGTAPGTLVANPEAPRPRIHVIAYGPDGIVEKELTDPAEIPELQKAWPVIWVDVDSLGDLPLVEKLGTIFGLHRLALEDVTHVQQRAKAEAYADHLYFVARMIESQEPLVTEQFSLFFGKGWVLTFQERPGDCFEPVRRRARDGLGSLRKSGADYLVYTLIDMIVDTYFPALEAFGERLEELEGDVVDKPGPKVAHQIQHVRRDLLQMRRATWPMREAIAILQREHCAFVTDETRIYLRDCHDHSVQLLDLVETYRELAASLMDMYLSSMSNKLNEVMKVLTVIATIFIPMSWVAGIYGMNFDTRASPLNMPELHWYWGYPFSLGLMAAIAGGLLLWFRHRGWLGGSPHRQRRD